LGELTALPQAHSWFKRTYFYGEGRERGKGEKKG